MFFQFVINRKVYSPISRSSQSNCTESLVKSEQSFFFYHRFDCLYQIGIFTCGMHILNLVSSTNHIKRTANKSCNKSSRYATFSLIHPTVLIHFIFSKFISHKNKNYSKSQLTKPVFIVSLLLIKSCIEQTVRDMLAINNARQVSLELTAKSFSKNDMLGSRLKTS